MSESDNKASVALTGAERIAHERARQVHVKGRTAEHDADVNRRGELVQAAIFYADPGAFMGSNKRCAFVTRFDAFGFAVENVAPEGWVALDVSRAKKDRIERLVIAGALIAAEIDRLTADLTAPRRCGDCGDLVGRCECS